MYDRVEEANEAIRPRAPHLVVVLRTRVRADLGDGNNNNNTHIMLGPAPVAQSVAFTLPKNGCREDLDQIPVGDNKIEMKGLGT